jgi:hypothetical protein
MKPKYKLTHSEEENTTFVEILSDEYEGVVYFYKKARVIEEGELAKLEFSYEIIDSGRNSMKSLLSDENFSIIMGEILNEILIKQIEHDEQTGTDNTQKFDSQ